MTVIDENRARVRTWTSCVKCGGQAPDDDRRLTAIDAERDRIVSPVCERCLLEIEGPRDPGHLASDPGDLGAAAEAPSEDTSPLGVMRSRLVRGVDAIRSIPRRRPLVAGVLDLDSFAVMIGLPGHGKSFSATDLALSVAHGSWWHGHRVRQGPVLYVVAEGSGGVGDRIHAWTLQNRVYGQVEDFVVLPVAVNLLDPVAAATVAAIAHELGAVLVIVDTLNRSMPGGDENTSRDMGLVIAAADLIRTRTGACVLYVHHKGKSEGQGARGHSSLLGAVDTELEVKKADGIITLSTTKQKDKPDGGTPLRFVLTPHEWSCDACDGDEDCGVCAGTRKVGSVAIAPYTGRTPDDTEDPKALDALDALSAIDVPGGVTATEWKSAATAGNSLRSGMSESTFFEKRKTLLSTGKVRQAGEGRSARYTVTTRENA